MPSPIARWFSWRPGAYASDGLRIFFWLVVRALLQAVTVLLLARWLGADGYGLFVAALAVASFFTPFAAMGLGPVILRDGVRQAQYRETVFAPVLRWWWRASAFCVAGALTAMVLALPSAVSWGALVSLALGEVAAASMVEISARLAQARYQPARFGAIQAGLPGARLLALLMLAAAGTTTAESWMFAYGFSSALYAATLAGIEVGRVRSGARRTSPISPRQGLPFVTGAVAMRLQTEFNKPVLAHLSYAEAGSFAVAQRLVDVVTLPLVALQEALWPRVYAAGKPAERLRHTGALLLWLALATGAVLSLLAPWLPWLVGAQYRDAEKAMRGFALWPLLQVARSLGNAWLIAEGRTHALVAVSVIAAASGIVFALLWIPRYALFGAVAAMYASAIVAVGMQTWWMVCRRRS